MQVNVITPLNFRTSSIQSSKIDNSTIYTGLSAIPACSLIGGLIKNQIDNKKYSNMENEYLKYSDSKQLELINATLTTINKRHSLLDKAEIISDTKNAAFERMQNMNYKDSIAKDELKKALIFPLNRVSKNQPVEMPNCIMLVGKNRNFGENLAKWAAKHGNAMLFISADTDKIIEYLEKHEKINQPINNDWTVIYLKDGDKCINPKFSSNSTIASMKDFMSSAAEDFHATLIFQTENLSELDEIALQPHRVKKIIDIENIEPKNFFKYEQTSAKLAPILNEIDKLTTKIETNQKAEKDFIEKKEFLKNEMKNFKDNKKQRIIKWSLFGAIAGILIIFAQKIIKERSIKNDSTN